MDAALGFGDGDALHAVHPALELEPGKNTFGGIVGVALDRNLHVLVAAQVRLRGRDDLGLPAAGFRVAGVHPQEVGSEQGSLVAAFTALDFQDHVAGVVRIAGNEQPPEFGRRNFQRLLQLRHLGCELGILVRHLLGSSKVILDRFPLVVGLNNAIELSRTAPQFPGKPLVSINSRIPQLRLDSIMLIKQALYGLKHFQNLFRLVQV